MAGGEQELVHEPFAELLKVEAEMRLAAAAAKFCLNPGCARL